MSVKEHIPWWAKIAVKIVLSRVPVNARVWQRLNLFKPGQMESARYAFDVFEKHFKNLKLRGHDSGFVVLELGPGDTLSTALIAKAFGASKIYLVDSAPLARMDMAPYRDLISQLVERGLPVEDIKTCTSLQELLTACSADYLTTGVAAFDRIPDCSVDLIFSQAVLEHIRLRDFDHLAAGMSRVLKPDGICSHTVDLKDHLGGRLNNLRFSERVWESEFFARSGFYTNRIRLNDMIDRFTKVGLTPNVTRTSTFPKLPTRLSSLSLPFRELPEDELLISGFDVTLSHTQETLHITRLKAI